MIPLQVLAVLLGVAACVAMHYKKKARANVAVQAPVVSYMRALRPTLASHTHRTHALACALCTL